MHKPRVDSEGFKLREKQARPWLRVQRQCQGSLDGRFVFRFQVAVQTAQCLGAACKSLRGKSCNLLQEPTVPASFRYQEYGTPQSSSPYSTARILLLRLHERIDRHSDLLVSIGRSLKSLDSGLDARIAKAVRFEIGERMAGMEERIAQKILMRSSLPVSSEGGRGKPSPESQSSGQSAEPAERSARTCDKAAGNCGAKADHGRATIPPRMRVLRELPSTGALKHSFLRRFARTEGRLTDSQKEETCAGKPGLVARLLENIFGICEPDPKVGKEGSKVIHPQSNFHTGVLPRL